MALALKRMPSVVTPGASEATATTSSTQGRGRNARASTASPARPTVALKAASSEYPRWDSGTTENHSPATQADSGGCL